MRLSYKIIALVCYFGKFPWYFSYFVHSCKYNPSIDFLIFSDNETESELPPNVRMIFKTLTDIKEMASNKFCFEVSLLFPYKLCDFKPAYGLIFEDYTKEYDFWIQSDIDVIYGDLRSFITDDILTKNDFVSVRHDYTSGCFTVSRNSVKMNNFFKRSSDYNNIYTTEVYLGFDELNFKHCEINEGKELAEIKTEIECFTHIVRKAQVNKEINAHFDFILIEGVPGKIKFIKGKLIYKNKYEAALYHLYWLKKIYQPKKILNKIPNTYFVSPTKIYFNKNNKAI